MTRFALFAALLVPFAGCDTAVPDLASASTAAANYDTRVPSSQTLPPPEPSDPNLGAALGQTHTYPIDHRGLDLYFSLNPGRGIHFHRIRMETDMGYDDGLKTAILYEEWDHELESYVLYGNWPKTYQNAQVCAYTTHPSDPKANPRCVPMTSNGAPIPLGVAVYLNENGAKTMSTDERSYHRQPDGRVLIDHTNSSGNIVEFHLASSSGAVYRSNGEPLNSVDGTLYVGVLLPDLGPATLPGIGSVELSFPTLAQVIFR